MKHIKMPVVVKPWEEDAASADVQEADGYYLALDLTTDAATELAAALNEHGDLVVQRDALVEAVNAADALHRHIAECDAFDTPDGKCPVCIELGLAERKARRAALAKVEGEK
jgi:hypothetical protein